MTLKPEQLAAYGFLPVTYDGQDGTFYAKTLKAGAMPQFNEHVVDDETVFDTDDVVVEVCPDGSVQLVNLNSDYVVTDVPYDSPEGRTMLVDAGFSFD